MDSIRFGGEPGGGKITNLSSPPMTRRDVVQLTVAGSGGAPDPPPTRAGPQDDGSSHKDKLPQVNVFQDAGQSCLFFAENGPGRAQEVFKKLPGGRTLHSDQIWAHGEP